MEFHRRHSRRIYSALSKSGMDSRKSAANAAVSYRVTYSAPNATAQTETDTDALKLLSPIAAGFSEFVTTLSPLTTIDKSTDELADILVEWLVSIDAYSEDSLHLQAENVVRKGELLSINDSVEDASTLTSDEKYLCARFVKHLFANNSPFISALFRIASIGLLTEVVQDFQKPITSVSQTDLVIYLDAPIALDLLGVSGKAQNENILPIVNQLQKIGATVRVFRVSINELKRALEAVLKRAPPQRTGPTADALRRGEVLEAYVREVARDPEASLAKLNIDILDRTLDQFPNDHEYFSKRHYEGLFARMTWHLEMSRREHDATVSSLIMRVRRGRQSPDLFRARQILVTRNGAFAQSVRKYCIENELMDRGSVGPAIHQRQLATAVWLRTGLSDEQMEDVPRRYLLAACEKVLELRKSVVDQVRFIASKLTPETAEQLDMLLTQDRSSQMLMDMTLGVSNVISAKNVDGLLEIMKNSLVEEMEKEKSDEVKNIRRAAVAQIDKEKSARERAEQKADKLQNSALAQAQEDKNVIVRLVEEINKSISRRSRLAHIGVGLAVFSVGFLPLFENIFSGAYKYSGLAIGGVVGSSLAYFQFLDKPLGVKARLGRWGEKRLNTLAADRGIENTLKRFRVTHTDGRLSISELDKPSKVGKLRL